MSEDLSVRVIHTSLYYKTIDVRLRLGVSSQSHFVLNIPMVSNGHTLEPKKPSHLQLRFISALDYDIVVEIFSYISQQDCLTCMAVGREWYYAIPSYTQNIWKEIQLETRDALMDHQRRRQCLGSHVKRVVLQSIEDHGEERPLVAVTQQLIDWKCTEIEYLELVHCTTPDLKSFIRALGQLASRLTHLHSAHHTRNTPLLPIFNVRRELTHFTYQHKSPHPERPQRWCIPSKGGDAEDREAVALPSRMPVDYRTEITYLRIDAVMDKKHLECVLKRCPELRCFIGVSCPTAWLSPGMQPPYDSADIDAILSWCPKINFLASNLSYISFGQLDDPCSYINDLPGLRYCNTATVDGINQMATHLMENQDSLEFVSIARWFPSDEEDRSPIFESLRMPSLRTLIFNDIKLYRVLPLVTMLNSCSVLQKLDMHCVDGLILDSTLIRSLCTMNLVRNLRINHVKFRDKLSMMAFLERFPALETLNLEGVSIPLEFSKYFQCPRQLKTLEMSEITWISDENQLLNMDERVARFLEQLIYGTELESLTLTYIPQFTSKGLLSIAVLPTLKRLKVQLDSNLQDEELLECIKMLGKSRIEQLTFYDCYNLSSAVLDALSELPLLEYFETAWCWDNECWTFMESEDLLRFLQKTQSLVDVHFLAAIVHESSTVLDCEQLVALLKSQDTKYDIAHSKPGHWEVVGSYDGLAFIDLTIKWLDS